MNGVHHFELLPAEGQNMHLPYTRSNLEERTELLVLQMPHMLWGQKQTNN
jgi:hypothetical protein